MYVIFPADEVVYLSYGSVIYLPQSYNNSGQIISDNNNSNNNNNNNNQETSSNRQSIRSHTSTVPSLPSTSTGSSKSAIRSSTGTTLNDDLQSDKKSNKGKLKRNKSRSSKDSKDSEEKPIRPQRYKKVKEAVNVPELKKDQYLRVPNSNISVNNTKSNQQETSSPSSTKKTSTLASTTTTTPTARRLSYSDFLPHQRLNVSPKRDINNKVNKKETNKIRNSSAVDFEELFENVQLNNSDNNSATNLSHRLQRTESLYSTTERPVVIKKKIRFGINITNSKKLENNNIMATHDSALKELTHPSYNEFLKQHNSVTFKLTKTVSDFTQQLGQIYERHAEELQVLVSNFRKRNAELRKERPACPSSLFHTWETLLQEVEIDSQALGDIASILGRQVSRPLLEKSFFRKIQSRKVFAHRESYETIISKTEEKLVKSRQEYKSAYLSYLTTPTTKTLSDYFNSHNAYVQQLHASNGMMDEFRIETLPQLLQELEEIYTDLCSSVSDSILQSAEVFSSRSMEQCRRYDVLISQCKAVSGSTDIAHVARALPPPQGRSTLMKRLFVAPQPPPPPEPTDGTDVQDIVNSHQENLPPPLKDELVIDRLSAVQVKPSYDALRKEATDLDTQIRQIQDALDTLLRIQQRSLEASLFNKANEIQEDISMKRFDLRVAQLHLSAINAQKELFAQKLDTGDSRERKMSSASQGSMKTKWLKAFKSLKTPPPESEKKNGSAAARELLKGDPDAHNFQEYTYKKITPCDVCSQVLRGHTRQGLKCRICKMNIHVDCQEKASKCQTKARLLRRQKSTSEIETALPENIEEEMTLYENCIESGSNRQLNIKDNNRLHPNSHIENKEVDLIYQVLKQAGEISNTKSSRVNMDVIPPTIGVNLDKAHSTSSNQGSSSGSSSGQSLNRRTITTTSSGTLQNPPWCHGTNLTVFNPAPCSTSSDRRHVQMMMQGSSTESSMRRRIFAGMKSLTGFGSRSRHGSPSHRSISLPEKRNSQDASGTRPFGQPLVLGSPQIENGNGVDTPPTPPSPSLSKGNTSPLNKKGTSMRNSTSAVSIYPENETNKFAPHSPRRQKLNLRMKSLSLDSPESTEHAQRRKHHGAANTSDPHSNQSSSSRIQFTVPVRPALNYLARSTYKANSTPSSPVHNRRLLSAKNIRMSSVELPDDNDKSPSSASTSPCPSPVGTKKSHRLLPTNLYVVLYNFKARHQDELDLKAGYKVTVIDTSDPDWWKGKCLGRVGYFPSKYCSKLSSSEKPLQVTHNLQVSDGDNGLMLLRDQIVIQIGEELDGMVMIRSGDNRQGVCPVKFLQEV